MGRARHPLAPRPTDDGHAGHNASTAAGAVGYESGSQFGPEFKRICGASPTEETASIRSGLAAGIEEARGQWVSELVGG